MVRTRADGCSAVRKAVAARAPRKILGGCSRSEPTSPSGSGNKYAGGNPVCPRPTPDWQRNITNFFKSSESSDCSSSSSQNKEDESKSTSGDISNTYQPGHSRNFTERFLLSEKAYFSRETTRMPRPVKYLNILPVVGAWRPMNNFGDTV